MPLVFAGAVPLWRVRDGTGVTSGVVEGQGSVWLEALNHVGSRLAADVLDTVWLFPAYTRGKVESVLVLVSAYHSDPRRRRIITVHRTAGPEMEPVVRLLEHGVAPMERVNPLVDGVLRRLPEELAVDPPRRCVVGGEVGRWQALLAGEMIADRGGG